MDKILGKKKEERLEEPAMEISTAKKYVAKKDFEIHQNEFHLVIKKGDDLRESVPEKYRPNLKTEGVI